jgi:hypothetical protein
MEVTSKLHPEWKRRLAQVLAILVGGTLTIALLAVWIDKANAQCAPSAGEPSCPYPSDFQSRWVAGFYDHAAGIPDRVLNTPGADHDIFVNTYVAFWKAHPGHQADMLAYATTLNKSAVLRKAAAAMARGSSQRGTCFFPLTPTCAAGLVWAEMNVRMRCLGWHTYPQLKVPPTCNRGRDPCDFDACTKGLTKDQFLTGIKIIACTVGVAGSVAIAIGSDGAGAPLMWGMAGGASAQCGVTVAEGVS